MSAPETVMELKQIEPVHVEDDFKGESDTHVQLRKSRLDDLSIPRTLWVFRRAVFFTFCVYTGFLCEGFELVAGSSVVANAGFVRQFGAQGSTDVRTLNPTWLSTWSAMLNVGQLVTFTYIAWFADRFGRKTSFYLAWIWLVVGCVFMNTAKSSPVWALGKLCNGAGIGVLQVVCQVYVMEIVPNKIRGGMITLQFVWSQLGGIVVSLMMQQLNQKHPDDYLIAMRVLWAPIGAMIFFWVIVPESPWYHARRGNRDAAMRSLRRLYGNIADYDFEEEYGIITHTIEHENAMLGNRASYRDLFKGVNTRRTCTVMILAATTQFCGLVIVQTYVTYFFALAGLADPFLASLIVSCCNLAAVLMWSLVADKYGRRYIVTCVQTLVCVLLFVVGGLYYTGASMGNVAAGTGLLVCTCVWSGGAQVIVLSYYVYSAELPSAVLRMKTAPVTFLANSFLGIISCYACPPMLLTLDLRTAFVYGAFSIPICVSLWLYLPETKGRSAAEIDELYENRTPAWRWSKTVTTVEHDQKAAIAFRARTTIHDEA